MATYKGGEGGGQKSSKKWLHGFCMPPFYFYMQFVVPYTSAKNTIHYFIHLLTRRMLKTFLGIIIFSSLIISNGNICEARHGNLMVNNRKMQKCSVKCAPQTCRIKCVQTMATTTITPTTITSTTTSTAPTSTTTIRTPAITNTKADYAKNQKVSNS